MDKNIEFIKKHGKSIMAVLRNSRLSRDRLQERCNLMRRSFKNQEDRDKLDDIERRIMDIINTTGKNQFSEDDIDIIIRQTLGMEIRDYDKSYLVNLDNKEIESVQPYPEKQQKPYPFGDTTITKIGTLTHKDWRGVEDLAGLSYYKIERTDEKGKVYTYKVFSHIDIGMMEDDIDYREAVLYSLLDEKNMTKTNCGGYIGSIKTVKEAKGADDSVKVNGRYSLVFDSTDATVVGMLRNMVKEKQNKEKGDEVR